VSSPQWHGSFAIQADAPNWHSFFRSAVNGGNGDTEELGDSWPAAKIG
jgi:hypothetical protein